MKKKLNLNHLSVQSFVTTLDASGTHALKGGVQLTGMETYTCPTLPVINCVHLSGLCDVSNNCLTGNYTG